MTKRNNKISVLITPEARSALDAAVLKYDSPQGKLINRMILNFCGVKESKASTTIKRSKPKTYPSNIDEQFELLWETKGKKGSKKKAFEKYKSMMEGETSEICEEATRIFIDDIIGCKHEVGYPELHLITYLNQERWVK